MSRKTITVHRIIGTIVAATIVSTTLGGLAPTTPAHALAVAPMAKCIPGSGNPLNPCP